MKGSRLVVLLAAVAAAALTARLGMWQLDRAAQKNALQAALDERRALPPLRSDALARSEAEAASQHHRTVHLRGRWAVDATVYLENRQMTGRPGFYVVTPLVLADGSAVAVQRGWLPRDSDDRTRIAIPATPSGELEVSGRVAPPPARLYEFDGAAPGPIRQNLDLAAWASETRLALKPLSVLQEDGATAVADGLLRQWPAPAAGVYKHHGYAFQWFALSALIVGLYVWFQLIRPQRQRRTG